MTSNPLQAGYTICLLSIFSVWAALANLGPAWGGLLLGYWGYEGREITQDKSPSGTVAACSASKLSANEMAQNLLEL